MNETEWKTFLTEYNRELLSYEQIVESLPRKLIQVGWLGHKGASESEILETERRLSASLPPSYRAFLKVSNGWRFPAISIFDLLPVSKITWFRERNQQWIDAYVHPVQGLPPISDEEYFNYGNEQDCIKFRTEYLQTALQISEESDSAVVLLNPKVVAPQGEWETWFFANWLPGAHRYRSFAEWLAAERRNCRKLLKPLPSAKIRKYVTSTKPVSVKKAQAVARIGQTDVALEALESFADKGDDSAAASLAELYAFLGQWEKVIDNAGRLIANPGAVYAGNVFDDMIRLLGRAGHACAQWTRVVDVVKLASKANSTRDYGEHGEWARDRNDKLFRNLIEYARRQGEPPREFLAIFGSRHSKDQKTPEEKAAWYDNAIRNVDSVRPDLKNNPQAKAEHLFSLAKEVVEDEALKLYEEHGANFLMAWEAAEYVARIYVQRGDPEAAWAAIEANLKKWWPVDHAQVAPVILLIDEHLNTLMTPERRQLVLSTPRGPEAAKDSTWKS